MSTSNRLSTETSPYLLQHAGNPVHWYPWGDEALSKAKAENLPILLSVGYAACHWCHVMERESFENEAIARLMNDSFVCIKVDREERPDIDEIYMSAVQMMTGSGGWPLTVFLTPELEPFFGGTYFPPEDRWGRPGFATLLKKIADVVQDEPSRVQESAKMLTEQIRSLTEIPQSSELLSRSVIADAVRELAARFDSNEGGFGQAPKFPPAAQLSLLLLHHYETGDADALSIVELTLSKMAGGGLYDHVGGGFHRYSTDARWLVPHFEKMLYDNALLSRVYLEAFQVTGNENYARTARECLDWVLRDMQGESGGYYSTLDADSEGVEGKFYVWSLDEIKTLLGEEDARLFASVYDVSTEGNWEGSNILNLPRPIDRIASELTLDPSALRQRLSGMKTKLLSARGERIWPGLDDKVLTSWNALMVIAMSRGARTLSEPKYYDSAVRATEFILDTMVQEGRLLATYRAGTAKLNAYLDDYAFLLGALVELYETDFDPRWLGEASRIASSLKGLFWDESTGGFFFTGSDHEPLISRTKSGYDGAIPSGNAVAALYLQRLALLNGNEEFRILGEKTIRAYQAQFERSPSGFPSLLLAVDFYLAETSEVVSVGARGSEELDRAMGSLAKIYAPRTVFAVKDTVPSTGDAVPQLPLFEGKSGSPDGKPIFYFCRNYACQAPTGVLADVESLLRGAGPLHS